MSRSTVSEEDAAATGKVTENDSLWGGETWTVVSLDPNDAFDLKLDDQVRFEEQGNNIVLIPHQDLSWRKSGRNHPPPIILHDLPIQGDPPNVKRLFWFHVHLDDSGTPKKLYLIEFEDEDAPITIKATDPNAPGHNGGSASLRR